MYHVTCREEVTCARYKFMEQQKRFNNWLDSANKLSGMALTEWPADSMPWLSTSKGERLLTLLMPLKFTGPKFASGCAIGKTEAWKESWKGIGPAGQQSCPNANGENLPISWRAVRSPTVLPRVFGLAPWWSESLSKNFLFLIMPLMYRASFTICDFPSSAPRKYWLKLTKHFNPSGCATDIPTLKKSQKRRSRPSLRGRSQLPAGPDPLPNLGSDRISTANPYDWPTQHLKDIRLHRTLLCTVPLSLSKSLQRRYLHRLSRTNIAKLLSKKNLSYPRQCLLSQRQNRLGLVFRPPQTHGSFQPSGLFSRTQRSGENLAPHTTSWHTQSLFPNAGRTSLNFNFHFSQHPEKSITGLWLFATIPINMSLYLCKAI